MITARQSRAARALLGWTQQELADKALVSLTALKRLESEKDLRVYETTEDQVRRVFEDAGIGRKWSKSCSALIRKLNPSAVGASMIVTLPERAG